MFTLNWYKHFANVMLGEALLKYKSLSGTEYAMTNSYTYISVGSTISNYPSVNNVLTSANKGTGGVIFGTGTTPATINDYKLSGERITGFAALAAVTRETHDSSVTLTTRYTITNNSEAEMTIGEAGIVKNLHNQYGTRESDSYKGLLERTVLDTPVTIPAGGIGQVEYTITFNLPTATTGTN